MNSLVEMEMVRALYRDRVRKAADRRRIVDARETPDVVIRPAGRADTAGLERLAELDSGRAPSGPALVAELDGRLVAALPLGGGQPLADPFVPSAPLVQMLELRAAQLRSFV